MTTNISFLVKLYLAKTGKSMVEVAKEAGLSYGHIVLIVNGKRHNITLLTCLKLAKVLGFSLNEITFSEKL